MESSHGVGVQRLFGDMKLAGKGISDLKGIKPDAKFMFLGGTDDVLRQIYTLRRVPRIVQSGHTKIAGETQTLDNLYAVAVIPSSPTHVEPLIALTYRVLRSWSPPRFYGNLAG